MTDTTDSLKYLIAKYMNFIADELRKNFPVSDFDRTINTGVWSNSSGIVTAYLTLHSSGNVSNENIDAVISLVPKKGKTKFMADICQPDGKIIAEIAKSDIVFNTTDELLVEVDKMCKNASEKFITDLKIILSKL